MNIPSDVPEALIERIKHIYPKETYISIFKAFKAERKTTLRRNALKINKEDFLSAALSEHIQLLPIEWYEDAYILESPTLRALTETTLYKNGYCYVQSLSSMIPPLLLNPQHDEHILDIAAAPGSKTTQLSMLMDNTGAIVANDSSQIRLYKLKANIERLGATNISIRKGVGQTIWQEYREYFDRVLVDVPCSMEGRIHFSEKESYVFWSTKKIKELQEIQKFLLKSALSATKPGGTLVYSTCTLTPEENEGVIDWIIKKFGNYVTVEEITETNIPFSDPLLFWKEKQYSKEITKCKRILPSDSYEGFFIAKLRKTTSMFQQSHNPVLGT